MRIFRVEIKGISPLMQHRYRFKDEKEESSKRRTGAIDYSEEWKEALFWDSEIGGYEPANHIESAMVKGSANFQIPGRRKKTYKDIFRSAIFVRPDRISLGLNGPLDKILESGKMLIDRRTEVVNKARVERLRPLFREWSLQFEIECHEDQVSGEVIKDILEYAGKYCGISERRPRYGRFSIKSFEEV